MLAVMNGLIIILNAVGIVCNHIYFHKTLVGSCHAEKVFFEVRERE